MPKLKKTPTTPIPEPERPATVDFLPAAPLPVSRDTPFRALGDVTWTTWLAEFRRVGSPFATDVIDGCYEFAQPVSALILHLGQWESTLGRSMVRPNNWLSLRVPGSLDFMAFDRPADCVRELIRRWTDPTYKQGVYLPRELSLGSMYSRYAPPNENPTEQRIRDAVADINRWRSGPSTLNFGPHPWPAGFDVALLSLPPVGRGWDNLGDRSLPGVMVGTCNHHTAGNDSRDSVRELFGPRGARFGQAMTDAVIDRTGKGYLLLDPWGKSNRVTPWASGPATDLKGAGIPFVQQLGANAVNKRLFSTEHCHAEGQQFTDAQIELSAKVHAVVICHERIPWYQWPHNNAIGGLDVALYHRHFAPTTCPSDEWASRVYPVWIEAVKTEARMLQGGGGDPGPTPPPLPHWSVGFTEQQIARFWSVAGGLQRRTPVGPVRVYPFDPAGPIGATWLARARVEGHFPAALEWWETIDGQNWVSFGDSENDIDWLLNTPSLTGRATWRWIDRWGVDT